MSYHNDDDNAFLSTAVASVAIDFFCNRSRRPRLRPLLPIKKKRRPRLSLLPPSSSVVLPLQKRCLGGAIANESPVRLAPDGVYDNEDDNDLLTTSSADNDDDNEKTTTTSDDDDNDYV